jgi:hypothetical protein
MAVVVTHSKTLVSPDSGSDDKVYGSDYVSPTSHTIAGLGTIATQDANNVSISGGAVTGITDLAVADGGTGASRRIGYRDHRLSSR